MWFIGVQVEQETSASPPKKNPGSAPVLRARFSFTFPIHGSYNVLNYSCRLEKPLNSVNVLEKYLISLLGSLSKGVFERRTSTGSEVVFILKHLYAPKFVFLSVLTIIETSYPKRWAKPLSKNETRPLPVDVRRSKTSLLKFRSWKSP